MLTIFQKRAFLFLLGCIGSRLLLAAVVKSMPLSYLPFFGYVGLVIGLSFIYLFFFGNKIADAQLEWTGEKSVWWANLRSVHGVVYLLFGYYAIMRNQDKAWKVLTFDALLGLGAWLHHHFAI